MKINTASFQKMKDPELFSLLEYYRKQRNFNVEKIISLKETLLSNYCNDWTIDTLIIPVSGGVDSSVVTQIASSVKDKNSNIKKVLMLFIPQFGEGATNQKTALIKVKELQSHLKSELLVIDITKLHNEVLSNFGNPSNWLKGQITTYLRTPIWYSMASALSDDSYKAIVLGTINFDEGGYLGFFSKSSDAMTDLQPISDLHKSEIIKIAKYSKLPTSIISSPPNGDMYHNRVDEELFGTNYDFVELYGWYLQLSKNEQTEINQNLSQKAQDEFKQLRKKLDALHLLNRHKYQVPPQGLHLTVLAANIPDGWKLIPYV